MFWRGNVGRGWQVMVAMSYIVEDHVSPMSLSG